MSEENKAIVRRWVEAFNVGNVDAVDELVTDSYVRHDPNSPEVRGPEEEKQLIAMYRSAFPDLHFTVEDMVAEGTRSSYELAYAPPTKVSCSASPDREPTDVHGDGILPPVGG
jgi:predicted ester cyclase